jgi:hypothetical protein
MIAQRRNDGAGRYVCRKAPGYPNCGRMTVKAEPVEGQVAEMLFHVIDDAALRATIEAKGETEDGLLDAIRRDEAALAAGVPVLPGAVLKP